MKVLNIHIDEFNTDTDLSLIINNSIGDGFILCNSFESAIKELKIQKNSDIRIFYSTLNSLIDMPYVQLYEVLYD